MEGDSRPEGTKHHLIKSGLHGDGSHCETLIDGGRFGCLHIICSFIPTFPLKIIQVPPLRIMKGTCETSSVPSVCLRDRQNDSEEQLLISNTTDESIRVDSLSRSVNTVSVQFIELM